MKEVITEKNVRDIYPAGKSNRDAWFLAINCLKIIRPSDWQEWLSKNTHAKWIDGEMHNPNFWEPLWVMIEENREMKISELIKKTSGSSVLVLALDNPGPLEIIDDPNASTPTDFLLESKASLSDRLPVIPPMDF